MRIIYWEGGRIMLNEFPEKLRWESYDNVKYKLTSGDVVAFGGYSYISNTIKEFTKSVVSHVGVVVEDVVCGNRMLLIAEALANFDDRAKKSGVSLSRLSSVIFKEEGRSDIWFLRLSDESRCKFNNAKFMDFIYNSTKKEYDYKQAIIAGMDNKIIKHINREDLGKLFCSELVSAALEAAGVLPNINASNITPIALCSFKIYDNTYYYIGNEKKYIEGFNSVEVK